MKQNLSRGHKLNQGSGKFFEDPLVWASQSTLHYIVVGPENLLLWSGGQVAYRRMSLRPPQLDDHGALAFRSLLQIFDGSWLLSWSARDCVRIPLVNIYGTFFSGIVRPAGCLSQNRLPKVPCPRWDTFPFMVPLMDMFAFTFLFTDTFRFRLGHDVVQSGASLTASHSLNPVVRHRGVIQECCFLKTSAAMTAKFSSAV